LRDLSEAAIMAASLFLFDCFFVLYLIGDTIDVLFKPNINTVHYAL
jgi:hypothetical protein